MTLPLPERLIELRRAVVDSYRMRDKSWRPDPGIVDQLLAAEQAHHVTVLQVSDGRSSGALLPAQGDTATL